MTDSFTGAIETQHADAMTPTELLLRARDGDRDALARWLRETLPVAAALLASRLPAARRSQELDDLVQETALRAMASIGRLKRPEQGLSWLCGIALNALEEHRRRLTRHGKIMTTDSERIADAPAAAADAPGLGGALQQAIEALPGIYREALTLKYAAGLRYREIAEALGITPDTVKARLTEARRRLRATLEDTRDE